MNYFSSKINKIYDYLGSNSNGLTEATVINNRKKYGANVTTKKKQKSIFKKILEAMLDPMLLILEIAFIITIGVNVGKIAKGIESDFYECIGIFISIGISVALTVIMEGKSQKAYELLNNVNEFSAVKVIRNGEIQIVKQNELVVGDVVFLESGNKIYADGRIISVNNFKVDESTLTGESVAISKKDVILNEKTPLAERINCVYNGTFVVEGTAKYIVTAVGDNTETGKISHDLQVENTISKPLQEKLNRLSKLITALGAIASIFVLILTLIKLFLTKNVNFDTVENAFLSSIILIVASVPEGLPTTVAISLTLNLVKLSKQNALIRKLIATETIGCVSVICSDKTGTLTENKMKFKKVVKGVDLTEEKLLKSQEIINNICINSTAEIKQNDGVTEYFGSITECALLDGVKKNKIDYQVVRESAKIESRIPFSSQIKYMQTNTTEKSYIKGACEVILNKCNLTYYQKNDIISAINKQLIQGGRVLCFASKNNTENLFNYDGFAVITDEIRKDVQKSVKDCKNAGIKVKILTGDSVETAFYVSKTLKIAEKSTEVLLGSDIDEMSDAELKKIINDVNVVARSTPKTKLRIVNALKQNGEVVAVTGDGVNDAPAIKNADIGIAMGSGSEITKEVSDVILLDDSFSTIITAIFFGRNVYLNFQRFIMFQLSVNLTAVLFIIISLITGLDNPFNTMQLLWVNLIMDGPPALTLGLETRSKSVMNKKPIKRTDNIVTSKMFFRIVLHAIIMCAILFFEYQSNFLKVKKEQLSTVIFTLFVLLNLFNAFNARETGSESIFKNLKNNKLMLYTFLATFVLQIIITEFAGDFFKTVPLGFEVWIQTILLAFSIVLISEFYKWIFRIINKNLKNKKKV